MLPDSSLIWTMALRIVAQASFTSVTNWHECQIEAPCRTPRVPWDRRRCHKGPGSDHRADATQGEGWTPSGCCSRRGYGHPTRLSRTALPQQTTAPPAACRQRSDAADRGGYPPCPESWT
eukprot:498246-Hanusia_phi.AAC.3